jgi:poly(3-hydroxybutyrate) depolymerase
MKTQWSSPAKLLIMAALFLLPGRSAFGTVLDKTKNIGGADVHYKVVLPNGYDPAKAYPGVLAFPGGSQDMNTVEGTVERHWRAEAERRGYIVVVPAAPFGLLFFEGGDQIFPDFITMILSDYKIQDNKLHLAGVSNGGISAFHIAASYPEYFLSVTGFPGYLLEATPERMHALSKMCINMHVGELDTGWLESMKKQSDEFRAQGFTVRFTVEKAQHHRLETMEGEGAARFFNQFEEARKGCGK